MDLSWHCCHSPSQQLQSLMEHQVSRAERAQILPSALLLTTNWGRLKNSRTRIFIASFLPGWSAQQIASYEIKKSCPCPEKQANGMREGEAAPRNTRTMPGRAGRGEGRMVQVLPWKPSHDFCCFLSFHTQHRSNS